ncbi:MAG: ABC transporter substrate-binding protein [Treponema sp.]|nr:ABC transporter substrate-binding protein [Treponema sp.]
MIVADANSTHHLNLYVAYEKGLFAKWGLDVEIQQTSSGAAAGGEFTLLRKVYFWHAFGSIIMSLKTGVAMGLVMLLIGESYGGRMGIGYLPGQAKDYFVIPEMMVCMVIPGWIGWFLIEILKYVEIKLAIWKVGMWPYQGPDLKSFFLLLIRLFRPRGQILFILIIAHIRLFGPRYSTLNFDTSRTSTSILSLLFPLMVLTRFTATLI